ncbi:sodium/potassium/calcium exchanger 3-like isoform X5 [Cygnus atratus]|uniref:sodium/potassium/calcium exchanger 3-like isoform X5 n=1 Tax=Cygnus atratus TaxID=8868 RepID=UPI0021B7D533|nr:sodium/potassium/calcium exchanger 3-like isoform X5 [Cygnus atratus]
MGASAAERRRRRRGELLRGQLGALAALALLLAGCAAGRGGYDALSYSVEIDDKWSGRQLLQANEDNTTEVPEDGGQLYVRNCTEPALHEFPNDIFTNEDRRHGAVILHVLCAMYMFYALAIVCDDFFVPSLEKICERLHLSEDVAGATFMAAGSSAPELFTSVIGVFITKGDVGVGTIVGSAVFNILCIIGVCGLFAGQVVALSSWSLLRDSIYYTLSVVALIVFIYDEKVSWWESLVLVLMYAIYIVIMKYNSTIHHCFERKTKNAANMVNGLANNTEMDDNSNCDATVVLLKKGNFHRKASVIMVDELLSAYPHQLSFSEAGLRIMITSHFPPKTRLSMASRMLINERQRLINSRTYTNGESEVAIKIPIKHVVENGTGPSNSAERGMNSTRREEDMAEAGTETENENEDNENNENDEEEDEDDDDDDHEGPYTPFDLPTGKIEVLKWLFTWPLSFVLYFTVPNCNKPHLEKWFMVTFASSTLWIAAFSYMMVWMVTIIGYTLGIPDVIMGITFLAAGTSVPDCMASLIVARQGMGDMAVSNSIGSNVFDILIGLGLPWALQTLAVNYGSYEFKAFSGVFPGTMSSLTMKAHCLDKRGSFFKLIDTIASEIGELKHEMVQTDLTVEDESADLQSLVKDMDNVSPEKKVVKGCPRDSGYDSLSNKLSILDKLLHTHPVWLQLGLNDAEAVEILRAQPAGIFLVRKSARLQKKVISLRLPRDCGSCLKEFAIKESTYTFSLEGSGISFADLFRLIAFYCISRDVLPFTLKLPHAIAAAKTEVELEEIAQLGLNVVLEKAMHKCILKPLKGHIEVMLKEFHTADGSWKQLKENLQLVRQRNPQELGVFVPTPDFVDVEKIKVKFMTMQKMYSPEKKVMLLLRVCKLIYTVMENNSGRLYGADDFLPVLTYVLAQCDMLELDTEIEYMMELLDPSLLHGEGGYYLTSAYGALSLIKNFQEEQAARLLSSEARDTLRQWHKRRTTNRTIPSVDDFQNYLRVAFQEVNSGCTGKTLLVRPYITTEDVCQLCAEKFKVDNPKEYSLFLFVDDTWQQLTEDTYPQKIKAELHSRPQPQVFHFVYKRINSDPYGAIFQNNSAS